MVILQVAGCNKRFTMVDQGGFSRRVDGFLRRNKLQQNPPSLASSQDFSALDTPRSQSVQTVTCTICAWGDIASMSGQPMGNLNILE